MSIAQLVVFFVRHQFDGRFITEQMQVFIAYAGAVLSCNTTNAKLQIMLIYDNTNGVNAADWNAVSRRDNNSLVFYHCPLR